MSLENKLICSVNKRTFSLSREKALLHQLLENNVDIGYGCRSGICHACEVNIVEETRDVQCKQKTVLSCQYVPQSSIQILGEITREKVTGKIVAVHGLNHNIVELLVDVNLDYKPGQFFRLFGPSGISRNYSAASHPKKSDYLTFHIKRHEHGIMSQWLASHLVAGDTIQLEGPYGKCVYQGKQQQALLMCCISTGLAPILGVLEDAFYHKHTGDIQLVLGARNSNDFYLKARLLKLQREHPHLHVHFISLDQVDTHIGNIYQYIASRWPKLDDYFIYLGGATSFIKKMQRQCYLSGASLDRIISDAFG